MPSFSAMRLGFTLGLAWALASDPLSLGLLFVGSFIPLGRWKRLYFTLFVLSAFLLPISAPFWMLAGAWASELEFVPIIISAFFGYALSIGVALPFLGESAAKIGVIVLSALAGAFEWKRPTAAPVYRARAPRGILLLASLGLFSAWHFLIPISQGGVGAKLALSVAILSGIGATRFFPRSHRTTTGLVPAIAFIGTLPLLFPGVVSAQVYPHGPLAFTALFLFAPTAYFLVPLLPVHGSKSAFFELALSVGVLGTIQNYFGFPALFLTGLMGALFLLRKNLNWSVMASVLFCAGFGFLEGDRFVAPPGEYVLQSFRDKDQTYALTREKGDGITDGDIKIRKNLHQVLESLKLYRSHRRYSLLPMRLHPAPKRVLVIGAHIGPALSAALEQKPELLVILEPREGIFSFLKWFTSEAASQNQATKTVRVVGTPTEYLKSTDQYFDVIVINPGNPRDADFASLYSVDFLLLCQSRLYSDGVLAQWFWITQWSENLMARAVQGFKSVFPKATQAWRSDLLPEDPSFALISQNKSATPRSQAVARPPTNDALLSSLPGTLALYLGDEAALSHLFPDSARAFTSDRRDLEWLSSFARASQEKLLDQNLYLKFLTTLSFEDGPPYGALLWTRAVLGSRKREPTWRADLDSAQKAMGIDLTKEYPGVF